MKYGWAAEPRHCVIYCVETIIGLCGCWMIHLGGQNFSAGNRRNWRELCLLPCHLFVKIGQSSGFSVVNDVYNEAHSKVARHWHSVVRKRRPWQPDYEIHCISFVVKWWGMRGRYQMEVKLLWNNHFQTPPVVLKFRPKVTANTYSVSLHQALHLHESFSNSEISHGPIRMET